MIVQELKKRGYQEGMQQGIREGKLQGVQEGMKRGIQQGMEKGKHEARRETARALLGENMSVEKISRITGLDAGEIERLKEGI